MTTALPYTGPINTIEQEVLAWRSWNIGNERGRTFWIDDAPVLWSVVLPCCWLAPVQTADALPGLGNTSGIYALRHFPRRVRFQDWWHHDTYREYLDDTPVQGVVALSGRVVQGTRGYRAERAVVRALWLNNWYLWPQWAQKDRQAVIRGLEERYQVDVFDEPEPRTRRRLEREFGITSERPEEDEQ